MWICKEAGKIKEAPDIIAVLLSCVSDVCDDSVRKNESENKKQDVSPLTFLHG